MNACFANQCPQHASKPGALCVYHQPANPHDWRPITNALLRWECLGREVRIAKRTAVTEAKAFELAQTRVREACGTWWPDVQPRPGMGYREWVAFLEAFVGGQVQQVTVSMGRKAA